MRVRIKGNMGGNFVKSHYKGEKVGVGYSFMKIFFPIDIFLQCVIDKKWRVFKHNDGVVIDLFASIFCQLVCYPILFSVDLLYKGISLLSVQVPFQ